MTEYDIDLAESLALLANQLAAGQILVPDPDRTALYLGLLSTELSLKAMLEQAGVPINRIRAHSHNLQGLLNAVGACKVEIEATRGCQSMVPASRIRGELVQRGGAEITVGELIDASTNRVITSNHGLAASTYPNAIRYGGKVTHYPPNVVASLATTVHAFAKTHWQSLRAP